MNREEAYRKVHLEVLKHPKDYRDGFYAGYALGSGALEEKHKDGRGGADVRTCECCGGHTSILIEYDAEYLCPECFCEAICNDIKASTVPMADQLGFPIFIDEENER